MGPCIQSLAVVGGGVYYSGNSVEPGVAADLFAGIDSLVCNLNSGIPEVVVKIKEAVPRLKIAFVQESGAESAEGWGWDKKLTHAQGTACVEGFLTITRDAAKYLTAMTGKRAAYVGVPGPMATWPPGNTLPRRLPGQPWPNPHIVSLGNWGDHRRGGIANAMAILSGIKDVRVRFGIKNKIEHDTVVAIANAYGLESERLMPHGPLDYFGPGKFLASYADTSVGMQIDTGTAWGRAMVDFLSLGIPVVASTRLGATHAPEDWAGPALIDRTHEADGLVSADPIAGLGEAVEAVRRWLEIDDGERDVPSGKVAAFADAHFGLEASAGRLAAGLAHLGMLPS